MSSLEKRGIRDDLVTVYNHLKGARGDLASSPKEPATGQGGHGLKLHQAGHSGGFLPRKSDGTLGWAIRGGAGEVFKERRDVAVSAVVKLTRRCWVTVQVSAVEVITPEEMFVENGTDAKLPCTFTSLEVISSAASVSWSFQPEGAATQISFFYYSNGKSYPGKDIPFKDRITWAGDLNKKDASITISNMQFRDNGTYICDVKNPPDIVVKPGEIRVRVVEKDNLPAFPIATVAGIAIGTVTGLSSLISIVVCLVIRKNNSKKRYSGCSTSESLMSPVKQAPQKAPSDTEGLVNSVPARSHQGPVIYAQLDHSGGQHSDKINKSESVVYADIRKN
ncbi:hypothetical protein HGM15179_003772 [Zosterops borbonicus]|uniref:Ig-like domain-containing protein n=1 Tax=Zosterops borbonicus TaxID=364589 RepID=A0A8K1GQD4_9PASS|nr:hypothetical protein HGM15179_003772 [Zosterops borbonicus]